MGSATRDDLVMDKKDLLRFLSNHICIEEKVDGANLGITVTAEYPKQLILISIKLIYMNKPLRKQLKG